MFLITSAAYIGQDLSVEVGRIPPSFLPVANLRLYERQISSLREFGDDIYLSLPASFVLPVADEFRLQELSVTIIRVPDGVTLGESILYCWNASGKIYSHLRILHGDTLFPGFNIMELDRVSIGPNKNSYNRALIELDSENRLTSLNEAWVNDARQVLTGFFSFSKPHPFMKSIIEEKNDFVSALRNYVSSFDIFCETLPNWLDFGHLNSFFSSRAQLTTERAFNELVITNRRVCKKSKDLQKMQAEANWYKTLPAGLRLYTPALLEEYTSCNGVGSYITEYLHLLPLSDIFVFGNHSTIVWRDIFIDTQSILKAFKDAPLGRVSSEELLGIDALYKNKTVQRLEVFSKQQNFNASELLDIAHFSSNFIKNATIKNACHMHGDFCFSNILFDSRVNSLKVVDPRGFIGSGQITTIGDSRYDLAKLYHSAIGCYDLIISGRYVETGDDIQFHNELYLEQIEKVYREVFFNDNDQVKETEILAISINLFLSMLPLHNDKPRHQKAMIANARRLARKLEGLC